MTRSSSPLCSSLPSPTLPAVSTKITCPQPPKPRPRQQGKPATGERTDRRSSELKKSTKFCVCCQLHHCYSPDSVDQIRSGLLVAELE
eukprot:1719232-Pleurochrysis_carterae.AAC.1